MKNKELYEAIKKIVKTYLNSILICPPEDIEKDSNVIAKSISEAVPEKKYLQHHTIMCKCSACGEEIAHNAFYDTLLKNLRGK